MWGVTFTWGVINQHLRYSVVYTYIGCFILVFSITKASITRNCNCSNHESNSCNKDHTLVHSIADSNFLLTDTAATDDSNVLFE